MKLLIQGQIINFDNVAHVYPKDEIHKEESKFRVYMHFQSGARTYFKFETDERRQIFIDEIADLWGVKVYSI